jgi:hypothetical protein
MIRRISAHRYIFVALSWGSFFTSLLLADTSSLGWCIASFGGGIFFLLLYLATDPYLGEIGYEETAEKMSAITQMGFLERDAIGSDTLRWRQEIEEETL